MVFKIKLRIKVDSKKPTVIAGTEELLTQAIGKIFKGSFLFALLKLMTKLGGVVSASRV
jgi:hypothetical protein